MAMKRSKHAELLYMKSEEDGTVVEIMFGKAVNP